jgi:hypothetical protein
VPNQGSGENKNMGFRPMLLTTSKEKPGFRHELTYTVAV